MRILAEMFKPLLILSGVVTVLFLLISTLGDLRPASAGEEAYPIPAPAMDSPAASGKGMQTAVVAGGCFWGVQGVFQHVKGVQQVLSGYSGGEAKTAYYDLVGSGRTGHAEAVQIVFDPGIISYGQILRIFFSVAHNPTELNRQGPDTGTQYRSAIFFANAEQKRVADAYIAQINKARIFKKPLATTVDPLKAFYLAESYHQDYLINHPDQPYIVYNDLPKVENLKRMFSEWYMDSPVTVASAKIH